MVFCGNCVFFTFVLTVYLIGEGATNGRSDNKDARKDWKKKDLTDYNDADVERLFEQWEEADEDELEEDEKPQYQRKHKPIDMSKLDPKNPEQFMRLSKKGQTLMMFATVAGDDVSEATTERISSMWHHGLFNAHIETQKYVVGKNRVLFMCPDGAQAWEIRDYLVTLDTVHSVEIEGMTYKGAGHPEMKDGSRVPKNGEDSRKTVPTSQKTKSKVKTDL